MTDKKKLCESLSHDFHNPSLLEAALSHRSAQGRNNERLEFLGDSILNFVIAEVLYVRYPQAKEGQLSRMRAYLVRGEMLAELAQEFSLGTYLRLGSGEMKSGGFRRESILADAMEAIIAAIYLDAGIDVVRHCIAKWYEGRFQQLRESEVAKDPKSTLQEYLQSRKLGLPQYEVIKVEGVAHAQTFYVRCVISELNCQAEASGSSRRRAEQSVAAQLLKYLKGRIP